MRADIVAAGWGLAGALLSGCAGVDSGGAEAPSSTDVSPMHDPAVAGIDPAGIAGVWYITLGQRHHTLSLAWGTNAALSGTITPEAAGATSPLRDLSWDPAAGRLHFEATADGESARFNLRVRAGVLVGLARIGAPDGLSPLLARSSPVAGYSAQMLATEGPCAFDLALADGKRARVRVDRGADETPRATFKIYGSASAGGADEELEYDASEVAWDGSLLAFTVARLGVRWRFAGEASGRDIRGTLTAADGAPSAWHGVRAEILSHGMVARSSAERESWARRTRERLAHLTMGGAASPTRATFVTGAPVTVPAGAAGAEFTRQEITATYGIADSEGGPELERRVHFYVSRPLAATPRGGFPVAIALNGHWGSAAQVMSATSAYAYGTAFARRGYVVLAVDVGHRPGGQRGGLYADYLTGDDPSSGNGTHPAVTADAASSWTEDGERAWDAMRALDYALSQSGVDAGRVLATGLSLGAEVATVFAAMDPRVTAVVASGFSPDLSVIRLRSNHSCWQWAHGDITEYLDWSDYHALIAPRPLLVQTGVVDVTFSNFSTPFSADKQVMRRSAAAYAGARGLLHDLHAGAHVYDLGLVLIPRWGDGGPAAGTAWQVDASTRETRMNVFDFSSWARWVR